ncbi:hypothetical protein EmuJ_000769400 [Echinococcus multilocularis]|uniref:Uncharacterized protein n=1 Tax=Echinococcus multilocularis TaxID=6211 RepID=A0A068YD35_ECHMU|nr:hypothetical protein EmuJ_000769400 [Echinococcus multilocularis]
MIKVSVTVEVLITLVILCLLIFRVLVWWRAEGTQGKWTFKEEEISTHDSGQEASFSSLTFCNANPLRGKNTILRELFFLFSHA